MGQEYITTYTGLHFYPTRPVKEDIRIEDIAHALSLLCRGNGQVKTFYSVGEHCLQCAREAQARGYGARLALACLLHDASECYLSDVPSPFKQFLKEYQALEERLLDLVYEKFLGSCLTKQEAQTVREIDKTVLAYDMYYLLGTGSEDGLPKLQTPYVYGKYGFLETEQAYLAFYRSAAQELTAVLSEE